jgi:transposase
LERRRRRAVELLEQGESPRTIARILGVHENSVHRWRRLARLEGLDAKPQGHRHCQLSAEQFQQLEALLLQGPQQHGWDNDLWTCERIAALIERHFGVRYHRDHVRKLLHQRLDWSHQKPEVRAREQDPFEVQWWKGHEFPEIYRDAWERNATILFLDESGFQLTPCMRHSWGPRGVTPILDAWQRRDRITAISAVTLHVRSGEAGLAFELLPTDLNAHADDIVRFLQDYRREHFEPLTVLWDNHSIHSTAKEVKQWLATQPDVVLEDLPPYAPKLNPDEMVWAWLKYARLANLAPANAEVLRERLIEELEWASFDTDLLRGFIDHTGLRDEWGAFNFT